METQNSKLCRLCLKQLKSNFEPVDNLKVGMLDVLLLKLNFSISKKPLMCQACTDTLEQSFYFKSACISVEQQINQYIITRRQRRVDLKEVHQSQRKNEKCDIMQDDQICRFCLKSFESYAMNEIGIDLSLMRLLRQYFPELDLDLTQLVSACENCLDGLINNCTFIMNCLNVEKQIKKCCESIRKNSTEQINLSAVLKFIEKNTSICNVEELKTDNFHTKLKQRNSVQSATLGCNIKYEKIEIKTDQRDQDSPQAGKKECPKSSSTEKKTKNHTKKCSDTDASQIYKCRFCPFLARRRNSVYSHQRIHRCPADIKMHKCDKCPFVTKYKESCTRHTQIYHTPPENIYGNASSLTLYKCNHCSYETKIKVNLANHMLRHSSSSEVTTYLCEICGFRSKHKLSLKRHRLIHENMSEIATFKCNRCEYEVKHKGNLRKHMLVHQDSSEVSIFKCNECAFETKHKISLRTHMLRHKNPSEVVLFKCDICGFKAKYKGNLKFHMITHKDSCNTVMYQCAHCSFETKHKMSLKIHVTKHKSNVATYKCQLCDFVSLYKTTLKKHMVVHKEEPAGDFYSVFPPCETLIEEGTEELIFKDD